MSFYHLLGFSPPILPSSSAVFAVVVVAVVEVVAAAIFVAVLPFVVVVVVVAVVRIHFQRLFSLSSFVVRSRQTSDFVGLGDS